jgi:Flp pilus assembly protein TadG
MTRRRRHQIIADERGQTATEFALVLPLFCLVLFAIIQFGIIFNNYVTLTDAVRAGARTAVVSRHDANPVGKTVARVQTAANGLDAGDLAVSVNAGAWQHGSDVTVEGTYPYEVNLLGLVVASGRLSSSTTERIE